MADDMPMTGDTAFILVCSALVFMMLLPGLALFYGGLVQEKHTLSVMMQCFGIACICSISWTCAGYSLAFSAGNPLIGDLQYAFIRPLIGHRAFMQGDIPVSAFFLFQGTFATITPALIIGAWAERARFVPVLLFSVIWQLLVYCPICHWVWGGGFLQQLGVRDFAGGLVVHASAGSAAIVAAKLLPPRPGFPDRCAPPHNLGMVMTGACLLWVGWFGFNGGSALHASSTAAMAAVTTATSAAVATLVWLAIEGTRSKPTVEAAVTGMVAGLGSVTPGSGFIGVPGAIIIGLVGGVACYAVTALVKERGLADDSLDVFSVHGISGLVGTILTAPLSARVLGGVGYDDGHPVGQLLGAQTLGCVVVLTWGALVSAVLLLAIDKTLGFCHSLRDQKVGLDIVEHGGRAYEGSGPLAEEKDVALWERRTSGDAESDTTASAEDDSALP